MRVSIKSKSSYFLLLIIYALFVDWFIVDMLLSLVYCSTFVCANLQCMNIVMECLVQTLISNHLLYSIYKTNFSLTVLF